MIPQDVQITPDLVVVLWGIVQSLLFEYVPGVAPWFEKQGDVEKRAIQALGVLVVALLVFVGGCAGLYNSEACTTNGVLQVGAVWFVAMVGNQTTHSVFKKQAKTS